MTVFLLEDLLKKRNTQGLKQLLNREVFFGAATEISYVAGRSPTDGCFATADRFGSDCPNPIP